MNAASAPRRIAILGAGITGLTAALRLSEQGHRVRVFEQTHRVGGAIRTECTDGWLIEAGPNSLMSDPWLDRLLNDLGLDGSRLPANPTARKRYIVRGGRPMAVPLSPQKLLFSRLFSPAAKIRILLELTARPRTRTSDLSIEKFVRAHFGHEVVKYGLNPFVTGVYAGDPGKLSARFAFPRIWEAEKNHGSLIRSQMAAAKANAGRPAAGIFSFPRGLQSLPDAIAARLPAETMVFRTCIEALIPGAPWNVVWHNGGTTQTDRFDGIITAIPGPALAQLRIGTLGERPLAALDAIEHPPVSSLFLGFRREQVAHPLDGFGLLVPAAESRTFLGVLFSSSLFPHRAPENHVALTVLIGGTRSPDLARLSAEELTTVIAPDLLELLGVSGAPVFYRHTFWPQAIPQYNLGHDHHFETMEEAERTYPGLYIGGQARDGISIASCVLGGERLARAIH